MTKSSHLNTGHSGNDVTWLSFQKSLENASPALGRVNALSLHLGNTTDTDLSMLDNLDLLQTINNGYLFLNH